MTQVLDITLSVKTEAGSTVSEFSETIMLEDGDIVDDVIHQAVADLENKTNGYLTNPDMQVQQALDDLTSLYKMRRESPVELLQFVAAAWRLSHGSDYPCSSTKGKTRKEKEAKK
jgi:2',3'-cyclic-nucleotide 2'-phosphodiesterase (5'-nucleotidase family)